MTWALAALMVAVALEAAVIAGLVLRLRAHTASEARLQSAESQGRFVWDEPMPWDPPQTDNQGKG